MWVGGIAYAVEKMARRRYAPAGVVGMPELAGRHEAKYLVEFAELRNRFATGLLPGGEKLSQTQQDSK